MLARDDTAPRAPIAAARSGISLRAWLPLAAIVALAFAIRCYRIGQIPVWIDEAASIGLGSLPWGVVFGEMARIEASPPGYYAIAKLVGLAAGQGGLPLRLVSAAAAALSIIPVWLFCREALGARAAWLAALVLALHALLFRMAQDGRTYAVLFFVFCCALLAAWRLAEAARLRQGAVGAVIALGLCQGAMLWLHHTAGIANLSLNAFVLVAALAAGQGAGRAVLLLAAADALGLLLGAPPILWAAGHALDGAFVTRWIEPPDLETTLLIYGRALVAPFHQPVSVVTGLVSILGIGWGVAARDQPGWPARMGLFALLCTAAILFPLVSQSWPVMLERTVMFMAAPLAAGIAGGLALLPARGFWPAALLLVGLHAHGVVTWLGWPNHIEGWDAVAETLERRAGPRDRIVVTDSVFALISLRMAAEPGGGLRQPVMLVPASSPLESRSAELLAPEETTPIGALCARLRGAEHVWIVTRPVPEVVADDPGFSVWRPVRAVLRAAGGQVIDDFGTAAIHLERWRVPGC